MPAYRLFLGPKIVFLLVILAQLAACAALDVHVEMPVLAPETGTATVEIATTAGSTITAETRARATITALAAENVHLAAQLTRDATSATPTTPSATPTCTPPATEAPTSTPKPSPRPSETPKPTPRPTSTPVEPQILSFTASPDPVERGGADGIHQALVRAALLDLGDWFRFEVERPARLPVEPLGGLRFPVRSLLDGRRFETFHVDVGWGDPLVIGS